MQSEEVMVTSYKRNSYETEGETFSSEEFLRMGSEALGGSGNPHP